MPSELCPAPPAGGSVLFFRDTQGPGMQACNSKIALPSRDLNTAAQACKAGSVPVQRVKPALQAWEVCGGF